MRITFLVLALLAASGCASIMHGGSEDIGLSSTPTSARVFVDKQALGQTPTIVHLSRKNNHIVRMELDGYQPFEATLTRRTSGWVWGNLVFGGLPGLAIDAITGGLYKLSPDQVAAQLARQGASTQATTDGILVTVVLHPDSSWQRVGTLARR
ncbi:MAG TPA: PEGA domain-containing protein [Gemmatimonadaceae bacterium]|jgi:hypothetical protein